MQISNILSGAPYYNDIDNSEINNYYQLLFVPGRSVQARELSQLQSIQFKQFQKIGNHFFKNGSVVIPGDISFNTKLQSIVFDVSAFSDPVKANLQDANYQNSNIINNFLSNGTVKAKIEFIKNIDTNTIKLYFTYIVSNSAVKEFTNAEVIDLVDSSDSIILENITVGTKGLASSASISDGIFYINGIFANVYSQSFILSDDAEPTFSVGLKVEEKIITENIDSSLVDPASGFSNYNAPGAHRYQLHLKLISLDPEDVFIDNDNYIELLRLKDGFATKHVTRSTYNILADELARRTYDESGDYTVRPFIASVENNESDPLTLKLSIEAGKAYVKGYEIETISKTVLDNLDKSRDFSSENNRTIYTPVGNYIECFLPDENFPLVSTHGAANIYNFAGTLIGTLKVRQILPGGTIIDPLVNNVSTKYYKVSIFDIRMNSGQTFDRAYSIGTAVGKIRIKQDLWKLEGIVSGSGTSLTGNQETRWFTSTENKLLENDLVMVLNTSNVPQYVRVTATPSTNTALAVTSLTGTITNSPIYRAYVTIKKGNESRLLFSLPYNRIKSIRDSSDLVDTNYIYSREVTGNITSNSSILTAPIGSDEFISSNPNDYIVIGATSKDALSVTNVALAGNQATLTFGATSDQAIQVITLFRDSNAPEKNKTYTPNQVYVFAASGVNASMTTSDFWIPHADIYSIVSIVNQSAQDVTDDYDFDNGQNDMFYDLGRLTLKQGKPIPTSVTVTYNYFAHSTGTYFSVNSYSVNLIETGKGYEYIPTYISKTDGKVWDLRDCLDFRPTINNTRTGFAHTSNIPVGFVSADFQYYLNRIDKLCLNQRGEFTIVKGIPALNPKSPSIPADSMALYDFQIRAYTFGPQDVFLKFIDNKRYTMRDIGKLENRIYNLEYYTTLSLLEKETADMEVLDENGLSRFKNGFIVDPFTGHGIGDVTNNEYRCSVDMELSECRPTFNSDIVDLETLDIDDVQMTGDLITLPYTETLMIEQPLATEFMNVNPYSVFSFLGRLELVPPQDIWKDTKQLPDLIVNQKGNYDSMVAVSKAFGTVWGEWENNWFGKEVVKDRQREVVGHGPNRPDTVHTTDWPIEIKITKTTTTTKSGMATRSGTQLKVIPETVLTDLGNKVVDVSYIPWMRSIKVEFVGKGFKPGSRLYAFFDDVNVSAFCSEGSEFNPAATIDTTPLIADSTGKVEGIFAIPANNPRFRTGKRKFTLSDSATNSELLRTTFGSDIFESSGLIETKQKTIVSTRNAKVVQETLIENKNISSSNTKVEVITKWEDPLAQSFLVTEKGGCFVSSLDLYFASKDSNIPVIVYISEMVNGYPSQTILPFSEVVIDSADITVTPVTDVLLSEEIAPTNIQFKSPVYLEENREYAFVVISNSNNYNLWIATGGKNKIGTQVPIQSQPYLGTLFKSQNASTWTAQQESDLKFRLHKCQFDISTELQCSFKNKTLLGKEISGISYLKPVNSGTADTLVKIDISNHGLNPGGGIIKITGASTIGDISDTLLNDSHSVVFADLNYIVIQIDDVVHSGGPVAGTIITGDPADVLVEVNVPYDSLYLNVPNIVLPGTSLNYGIKTTGGAHPQDTLALSNEYVTDSLEIPVFANQTIDFTNRKIFVSEDNMINVSGAESFELVANLFSTNPNLSPVIDVQGLSAICVENIVDVPDKSFTSEFDKKLIVDSASVVSDNSGSYFQVTQASGLFVDAKIGNYITVSGSASNNGDYLITDKYDIDSSGLKTRLVVSPAPVSLTESIDIELNSKFVDEISPNNGSAAAKYLTRSFGLAQPAESVRIQFAAYWPSSYALEVYYKTLTSSSSSGNISDEKWVKATLNSPLVYSNSYTDYREYTFDVNQLDEFSALQCKICFIGLDGNDVPKIKDLRVIALT